MSTLPLTPMLVQYLVGLCCLRWDPDAVDVTIGDMVYDTGAEKVRDVDVTVTVSEGGSPTHAFKAYEVKREKTPLDVAAVEQLCIKLTDMPSVTHRGIVSSSGYTEAAQTKAERHGVDLYTLREWTRPLEEQFPVLAPMRATAAECFPIEMSLLCWPDHKLTLVASEATSAFTVEAKDQLYDSRGALHARFANFGLYAHALLLRSTEILFRLEPAVSVQRTFPVPLSAPVGEVPSGPAWPHTHTLDVTRDDVYVRIPGLVRLDTVTISGHLQWQRSTEKPIYCVIERVSDGTAFAAALIAKDLRPGQMTGLILTPKTRDIGVHFVKLAEKHHNAIRELKLRIA